MNLEEMELQVKGLNRELEGIILSGAKYRVDLDLIEAKSEERRKLKDAIIQTKRQMRPGYKSTKLTAVHSSEVCRRNEDRYKEKRRKNQKYSIADYKPNKEGEFSITVKDYRHCFNTEEELYEHFVSFGDINKIRSGEIYLIVILVE